jgi:hypothetical protein
MRHLFILLSFTLLSVPGFTQDDSTGPLSDYNSSNSTATQAVTTSVTAPVTTAAAAPEAPSAWGTKTTHRQGMWALGFNAVPVLNFGLNVVNVFANTGQDATGMLTSPTGLNQTLFARYYLRDDLALRASVQLIASDATTVTYYEDPRDVVDPEVEAGDRTEVQDTTTTSSSNVVLGGGIEKRHSFGRFEGFYGAEAFLGFGGSKTSTDYGWKFSDRGNNAAEQLAGRTLINDGGTSIGLGARGFAGIEYFVLPELSISAEYGLGGSYSISPNGVIVTESWETTTDEDTGDVTGEAVTREAKTDASQVIALANDTGLNQIGANSAVALRLNFHF